MEIQYEKKKSAKRLDIEKSFTSNVWNGSLTSIANKTRSICESVFEGHRVLWLYPVR